MSKINLTTVTGGFNLSSINRNFEKVQDALNDKVLYRDNPVGEPNQMVSPLDMNGNRIYNLPAPVGDNEAARFIDIKQVIPASEEAVQAAIEAKEAAERAKADADRAAAAAGATEAGNIKIVNSYAEALALVEFVPDLQVVHVASDETKSSWQTTYRIENGLLVFQGYTLDSGAAPFRKSGELDPSTNVQAELQLHSADLASLLQDTTKKNHLWQGFFATWQAGHAVVSGPPQRKAIADGSTIARTNFATGVTGLHISGTHQRDAIRLQRDSGNGLTEPAVLVMNLTQSESRSLIGKQVCAQFHGSRSPTYTGSGVEFIVQYSEEQEQPILNADGSYTSGGVAVAQQYTLTTLPTALTNPNFLVVNIPATATQVSVVIKVPFTGTAGVADFVDIEGVGLTVGDKPALFAEESFENLLKQGRTRYQASLPYGAPRGTNTEQGSLSAIANSTAASWAFSSDLRFNPPMAGVPQVLFQSPLSGTENRWLDTVTNTFINGLAYNLTNTGVTLTNNGAVVDGRRYICQWTAQYIF